MQLNGINFGPCSVMSGTLGFFGEGYFFHRIPLMRHWLNFDGATFVTKTTTAYENAGNTPYAGPEKNYGPRELKPKSIWVTPWGWRKGFILNSVGLSGPGCEELFETSQWQRRGDAYMVSFMPTGGSREEKIAGTQYFADRWKHWMMSSASRIAIQLNISCPNVKADLSELIKEAGDYLNTLGELGVPVIVKINVLMAPEAAVELSQHQHCAGLCVSNTIPFGELPDQIPWGKWFPNGSPLKHLGGGGLSGAPILPILTQWLRGVFRAGLDKPVNAGGGILHPNDVNRLVGAGLRAGIDSVAFGSVAILRPWNVRPIIERAHALLS